MTGFFEKNKDKEQSLESAFDKNLSKENIGETIKKLSEDPHHLSSAKDKDCKIISPGRHKPFLCHGYQHKPVRTFLDRL